MPFSSSQDVLFKNDLNYNTSLIKNNNQGNDVYNFRKNLPLCKNYTNPDKKNLICKFDEKRYNSNSKKIEKYNYKSKKFEIIKPKITPKKTNNNTNYSPTNHTNPTHSSNPFGRFGYR